MDGKITSVDYAVSERMRLFMSHSGYTQAAIAEACNVDVSTLSRCMNNKKPWSSKMLQKIGSAFNVAFLWLRDGVGKMIAEEKAIGKAQFAAFSQMLDANTSPVSQNIISGDNYQGTQTINGTEGEIVALRQKVELLRRLLDEKDKLLEEKDKLIKEKDKQNSDKNERLSEKDKMIAEQSNVIVEQRKQLQTLMEIFGRNKD